MDLLDILSRCPTERYEGDTYRATRLNQEALAPSANGGRWAPPNQVPVLYTSLIKEGALAELSYHWGQLTPYPSKPAAIHRIRTTTEKTLRLKRTDLQELSVDLDRYHETNYERCQQIGAAVSFMECDGLIVPSARWDCDNLVLFIDNHSLSSELQVLESEQVDWLGWAREAGVLSDERG